MPATTGVEGGRRSHIQGTAEPSKTEAFPDAAWAVWEPLIEELRPRGKKPPKDLRRRIAAILWRHRNGAKWRSIPAGLGPWWRAVATRHEKTARSFLGVLCLAAAADWIKVSKL